MDQSNEVKHIPLPTIRRIPSYLRLLYEFKNDGNEWVSATDIANRLDLKSIQVRKDMAFTEITGKPKKGYRVDELIEAIRNFLGWNNTSDAFLVGAGALGAALLGYSGFNDNGLNIVAAFDTDPDKIGTTIHGCRVLPMSKLQDLAKRMHIQIGIITVPASKAQAVADTMVEGGIRGIWNFAPLKLNVPDDVYVQKEDLTEGFAVLSVKLQNT